MEGHNKQARLHSGGWSSIATIGGGGCGRHSPIAGDKSGSGGLCCGVRGDGGSRGGAGGRSSAQMCLFEFCSTEIASQQAPVKVE